MSKAIVTALFVLAVVAFTAAASAQQRRGGNPDAARMKNPVPATAASIGEGARAYQKYCKFCHGDAGKGDGALAPKGTHPSNLTDDDWDYGSSDGEILTVIAEGIGPGSTMKGVKSKLTTTEMWNVVNYLRSLNR